MTRQLVVVDSRDTSSVAHALRAALSADGPAIFPYPGTPVDVPRVVDQRVALVVETSGSTSRPKRVALSADALLTSAAAVQSALGEPGDWALVIPLHYIAGICVAVRAMASGTEFVAQDQDKAFDPMRFVASVKAHPVRYASFVPAQLARLLAVEEAVEVMRGMDRVIVGGQALPPELAADARENGITVSHTYGMSETAGSCVWDGVPIGDTRVRVVDGRVELSTSALAEGYLEDPLRTAASFRVDGSHRWFRTDDTGVLADGVLTVTGRLDDVIVSGGHKVSLAAVELALRAVPGLADCVVVAAPHPEWGETPVLVTTMEVSLSDVRDVVGERLGRVAAPSRVIVVPSIPMLTAGKPDRLSLAALARQ